MDTNLLKLEEVEQELIERERLAAIDEIVVTVNHKINNPLSTIVTNAEMLPSIIDNQNPDMVNRATERILKAAQQILKVTRQLSNLSSTEKEEYLPNVSMIALPEV